MSSRIDYDRAFAQHSALRSVKRHIDALKVEHPDYRIVAHSPFMVYPNGGLYVEPVVGPRLLVHWQITGEQFLLEHEVTGLAVSALQEAVEEQTLHALDARCRTFFPWLTQIRRAADRATVEHLKSKRLLN